MVARQNRRTVGGHVLPAVNLRSDDDLHRRTDRDELEEPVEQHASLGNCQTREHGRRWTIGQLCDVCPPVDAAAVSRRNLCPSPPCPPRCCLAPSRSRSRAGTARTAAPACCWYTASPAPRCACARGASTWRRRASRCDARCCRATARAGSTAIWSPSRTG